MGAAIRRFSRLSSAFSNQAENHAHAKAIHAAHYRFCNELISLLDDIKLHQ